ncbi:MAG: hypothetical protein U9R50_04140, partial [Campylobacterota bacterium]|nr:hypothetical protein [Campylobacterota bacterium]
FEIIDDVHDCVDAVLFESIYQGLSTKDLSYVGISQEDREWLLIQIEKIKKYNIPVIAVDYTKNPQSKLANATTKAIENLDLIPYIGDRDLVHIGLSSKNAKKREVLLVYDGTEYDGTEDDDKIYATAFQQLALPLEYMGYIPIFHDISLEMLPEAKLQRYAGAVVWIGGSYALDNPIIFEMKMAKLLDSNLKTLFIDTLDPQKHQALLEQLEIKYDRVQIKDVISTQTVKSKKKLIVNDTYMGYEIDPFIPRQSYYYDHANAEKLLEIINDANHSSTIAAITPWGGYAFNGSVMIRMYDYDVWIANPFTLLKDTLRLDDLAVPDPTTENGKRFLFVHMDGDGIMNRAEWNSKLFSGEVLYDEVFSEYKIPMSLSIIEGETAPYGLYGKDSTSVGYIGISEKLESISRDIFALDNVEPASHTFTHPFYWGKIINDDLDKKYRLKVQNYDFSLDREIRGSLDYVTNKLAPKDKNANMIFWSGDCLPTETTLDYMYKNSILHINGGDTTITEENPWLSTIAPYGIKRGEYYQIFTGAQNENVYTNDWLGPYWGYKKVIQTFELTDKPRRFKPIDIYFHTYSGSKKASKDALHTVFKWAMKQDVMPIYTSTYIPKVMDFYDISLAEQEDTWLIKGTKNLKTVRIAKDKVVDFKASTGVIGMKVHEESKYIHLDHNQSQFLVLNSQEVDQNYLIDANAILVDSLYKDNGIDLYFKGEVPVEMRYHIANGCKLQTIPNPAYKKTTDNIITVKYKKQKDVHIKLTCKEGDIQ